jgi:uncharacterized linocin/CFP29 family protein
MATRKPKPTKKRRKNVIIDQTKLDEARRILETDSETQTLEEALDSILFAEEVIAGMQALREVGGLEYFDPKDRPRKKRR